MRSLAAASVPPTVKGRYRSGQTGQTVNLLALRLRWFESSPAHWFFPNFNGLFADHLRGGRTPRRHSLHRRRHNRVLHPRVAVAPADGLH